MDRISAEHIVAFELQMAERLTEYFQLDLRALLYDGTPTPSPTSISAPRRNSRSRVTTSKNGATLDRSVSACW